MRYLSHLARALRRQKKPQESESLLRSALPEYTKRHGKEAWDALFATEQLAFALMDQEEMEEAESLFREILETAERATFPAPNAKDVLKGGAQHDLGVCLGRKGMLEEAERLLLEGYRFRLNYYGPNGWGTREVADRLVELYRTWGKPELAEEYLPPKAD